MNLEPCRVSVSCCFTTGLGAGRDLEHGAEPAVWPQSQERKQGLSQGTSAGVRGLVRAGRVGGSLAGGNCGTLPVCHLVLHPTALTALCLWAGSANTWSMARVGLGKLLALAKQPLPLGAGGSRAQAARAPQAMHGPDLPVAFALVFELQLCKSRPFLCPITMASAPQTLGQHILLWGTVAPLFIHLLILGWLPQATGRAQ